MYTSSVLRELPCKQQEQRKQRGQLTNTDLWRLRKQILSDTDNTVKASAGADRQSPTATPEVYLYAGP
jgi:hypothetical protein